MTTSPATRRTSERLSGIRARLAATSAGETQLRVMLVLAHEAVRQSELAREAGAPAADPGRAPAPVAHSPLAADRYAELVAAVRRTVERTVPSGSRVLVVSKGDEALLMPDHEAAHFPQGPGGGYAGHYPADGDAAIAHLEHCRAGGAEFLVVPSTAYWWLDYYEGLAQHLLVSGRAVHHDDVCAVFDLRSEAQKGITG